MNTRRQTASAYIITLVAILSFVSIVASQRENPFYYEDPELNTIIGDDGSIVKKLDKIVGNAKYNKRTALPVVFEDWEMQLEWYQDLYRYVFGKSEEEIVIE
jgi:hypothetical protein